MRRRLPATKGTLWLLMGGAMLGIALLLATQGLLHTLGGGLAGACLVVAFQLWLRLRRPDGSDPN